MVSPRKLSDDALVAALTSAYAAGHVDETQQLYREVDRRGLEWVEPDYRMRFVPETERAHLVNLYHLARTALADRPHAEQAPYHRMLWAVNEFHRQHPQYNKAAIYKDLCGLLDR